MRKETKATDIPPKVKRRVYERDQHKCVICGSLYGIPCAHYVPRSRGGLGIEQNVVTLCIYCHNAYDQSEQRPQYKKLIRDYLKSKYPDWDESKLVYRKGM